MAERVDERNGDRGRGARRVGLSAWLQLSGIVLACAAIVWKGGQMTEKLDAVVLKVDIVASQITAQQLDQATTRARIDAQEKELGHHERRISRIESRGRHDAP